MRTKVGETARGTTFECVISELGDEISISRIGGEEGTGCGSNGAGVVGGGSSTGLRHVTPVFCTSLAVFATALFCLAASFFANRIASFLCISFSISLACLAARSLPVYELRLSP